VEIGRLAEWFDPVNWESIRHLIIRGRSVSISLARRRWICISRAAHVGETATTRGLRLHGEPADARTAPSDSIAGAEAGPNAGFTIDKGMSRHGVVNRIGSSVSVRSR
jgi:hypothetical protein